MVRFGEIEHGAAIAAKAETVWNWSSPAGQVRARRRAQLIAQAARLCRGTHVLELGCGTGVFTEFFAQIGCSVVAVDVSPDLLECAVQKQMQGNMTFQIEDAEDLSFPKHMFDAVVGSSILHHLDVDRALLEVRRVLKDGGRLALAEPNMMNPQIALQRSIPLLRRWAGESPHETAFFRWKLRKRMCEVGFTQVEIRPYDFLHPLVPAPFIGAVNHVGQFCERLPGIREIAGSMIISAVR